VAGTSAGTAAGLFADNDDEDNMFGDDFEDEEAASLFQVSDPIVSTAEVNDLISMPDGNDSDLEESNFFGDTDSDEADGASSPAPISKKSGVVQVAKSNNSFSLFDDDAEEEDNSALFGPVKTTMTMNLFGDEDDEDDEDNSSLF
jgi:hypothetical protein